MDMQTIYTFKNTFFFVGNLSWATMKFTLYGTLL